MLLLPATLFVRPALLHHVAAALAQPLLLPPTAVALLLSPHPLAVPRPLPLPPAARLALELPLPLARADLLSLLI